MPRAETLIIGAGVIGSSLAAELGQSAVTVLDFDLEGLLSSSELNAGGVRATMTREPNILASKLSIEYFERHRAEVGYRDCGYLWLQPESRVGAARSAMALQRRCGWEVESFGLSELRKRAPFIDKTDGIEECFFAPKDGLINPNLLKLHFRKRAQHAGVNFEDRALVVDARIEESGPAPVKLTVKRWTCPLGVDQKHALATCSELESDATEVWEADRLVNCAGPWAPRISKMLGLAPISKPVRRQVCVFDSRDVDLSPYGMIVDTSGVYFHPEATNGMAGFAVSQEPEGYRFEYDGETFFQERIWAPLYERSTRFERLRHLTGWAGLYEVSPDDSAIIGEVPGTGGRVFEAHSFSGHGVMHSYAAGLGLAEKLLKGSYRTIDLTPFSRSRFLNPADRSMHEGWVI